jgi:hypothetical protein
MQSVHKNITEVDKIFIRSTVREHFKDHMVRLSFQVVIRSVKTTDRGISLW